MDQRVQFIADHQRDVFDVADLAQRNGISRKTAYKGIERDAAGGPAGLVDRSRRPGHSHAGRTSPGDADDPNGTDPEHVSVEKEDGAQHLILG